MHRDELLTFEEIDRSIRAFVANGVKKVRITGGEPMIRRNLPDLIFAAFRDSWSRRLEYDDQRVVAHRVHGSYVALSRTAAYHDKS